MTTPAASSVSRRSLALGGAVALTASACSAASSGTDRSRSGATHAPSSGSATAVETTHAGAGAPAPTVCSALSDEPVTIPDRGMHVVTLGTKGGPTVRTDRVQPCNLLVVDGVPYVIDAGQGVTRQLILAGVDLADLRAVFITHHHSDHNLELGNLLNAAWNANLASRVSVVAPAPIEAMMRAYLTLNEFDIRTRIKDEGKTPLAPLIVPKPIDGAGVVFQDDLVKVTAMRNTHPPITESYAFRFDTKHGSVVFSGDTAYDPEVARLADGADWLVHEVLHLPTLDALVRQHPEDAGLRKHLVASHTTNEQVGKVAAQAKVGALVLSHLVYFGEVSEDQWRENCSAHWDGRLLVARDLQLIR